MKHKMRNQEEFKALVYEKYQKEQLKKQQYRKRLFRCGAAFAACLTLFLIAIPFQKTQDSTSNGSLDSEQLPQQVYGQTSTDSFCSSDHSEKLGFGEVIYDRVKIYDSENGETKYYSATLPEVQEIISILQNGSASTDQGCSIPAKRIISLIPSDQKFACYSYYYNGSKNLIVSDSAKLQLSAESLQRLNTLLEKLEGTFQESEFQNQ